MTGPPSADPTPHRSGRPTSPARRPEFRRLVARCAEHYRPAGRTAYHFARGKLSGDPGFAAVLAQGLLAGRTRLLDLGCGQGVLALMLATLEADAARLGWPADWPPAPTGLVVRAVDLRGDAVRAARLAASRTGLDDRFRFEHADLREVDGGPFDAITIFDVLHYLAHAEQEAVIARCAASLEPGGVLLLRVADAARRARARWTLLNDALITLLRGGWPRFATREADAWRVLLERAGLEVDCQPMAEGTSFANVLLVARKPRSPRDAAPPVSPGR